MITLRKLPVAVAIAVGTLSAPTIVVDFIARLPRGERQRQKPD